MGEDQSAGRAQVDPNDPDEIRAQIEETRQELGDTVAALSAKTDVKAQAKERIEDTKAAIGQKRDEVIGKAREISPDSAVAAASTGRTKVAENPLPLAVAAAFAAGLVLGRLLARRGD